MIVKPRFKYEPQFSLPQINGSNDGIHGFILFLPNLFMVDNDPKLVVPPNVFGKKMNPISRGT